MRNLPARSFVVLGSLFGAAGVASAALASHGEDVRNLAAISAICLSHGPALLALGLAGRGRFLDVSAAVLAFGTLVFVTDLLLRHALGHAAFPFAAPLGGGAMILGWCGLALCGALNRFGRN